MTHTKTLRQARQSFEQKAWADSCRLFEAADRETALAPEDLERFATAAYLSGRDNESEALRERAHQAFLARGDREAAGRSAFWLAFGLQQRGARAAASGWLARAAHIVDETRRGAVVRGYLLVPSAIQQIAHGDPAAGLATLNRAAEIAEEFADRDLASLACHGRGRALIRLGQIAQGVALLDEAMVAVLAGEVSPLLAGDVYCSVLEGCQEIFDLPRAYEWTASLARWCEAQPDLVRYRGECLLYRAEILQLRGHWNDAAGDAAHACEMLISRPAAGAAFYRLGEIHRLRGQFAQAEAAYTQANERGRKPQPGLSLLRLAQGQIDAAALAIRSVLMDTQSPAARARILSAAIDILLAAKDLEHACTAAEELAEIARALHAPLLSAMSAHATGAVLLAKDDVAGAAVSLRRAWEMWRDLEMPYDEAQTRLLLAAICARRGDQDGRRLEIEAARRLFTDLDAAPCLARIALESERAGRRSVGPLSEREAQVLRLLAAGKTNRDIGEALFISEKTVARHVSNIFDKLGVSSRTAATAWAYQRNLI